MALQSNIWASGYDDARQQPRAKFHHQNAHKRAKTIIGIGIMMFLGLVMYELKAEPQNIGASGHPPTTQSIAPAAH